MALKNRLSKRLSMAARMVTQKRLCDVGCDHGYLPIALCREGVIESAVACDINEGPLRRAAQNIAAEGLSDRIITRLSDGLKEIGSDEADCVTVCGMGGRLIGHVIETNPALCERAELILQPQSDADWLKGKLLGAGYNLFDEDMVEEDGKYYICMKYRYCPEQKNEWGSILLAGRHPVYRRFLEREEQRLSGILSGLPEGAGERKRQVEEELTFVNEQLLCYGSGRSK